MLVLSRRPNEKIVLPSLGISIVVTGVSRKAVRLGIEAPPSVPIVRSEIASNVHCETPPDRKPSNHRLRNQVHTAALAVHLAQKQLEAGQSERAKHTLQEAMRHCEQIDQQLAAVPAELASRRGIHALIVEDNHNEGMLLAEFLRLHGVDVSLACDGQEAIEYLQSHQRPDVILLDMRMPRCDGPATLATIRGNVELDATKVFAVSGTDPHDVRLPADHQGLDGWFAKPVNPRKILDAMNLAVSPN
jgi:carbon storage regulator CsrA